MAKNQTAEGRSPRPKSKKVRHVSDPNFVPAPEGSSKDRKRVGRGAGSQLGKTSGRGQKGQRSRSGYSMRFGFEGGQLPIHRRIPKKGFTNALKIEYRAINLFFLEKSGIEGEVNPQSLHKAGLIANVKEPYKILSVGENVKPWKITAHRVSAKAKERVEKAGGSVTLLPDPKPLVKFQKKPVAPK